MKDINIQLRFLGEETISSTAGMSLPDIPGLLALARSCSRDSKRMEMREAGHGPRLAGTTGRERENHQGQPQPVLRNTFPLRSTRGRLLAQAHDLEYVRDLGLIDAGEPPRIANPIYAEVVPPGAGLHPAKQPGRAGGVVRGRRRQLGHGQAANGVRHLLRGAFRALAGALLEYPEAGPQLILQAYLHRVVNGGGRIEREYGLGRGRTDLLVLWPREPGQPSDLWERFVVECKVLRDSDRKSLAWTVRAGRGADVRLHGQVRGGGKTSGGDRPPRRRGGDRRSGTAPGSPSGCAPWGSAPPLRRAR